jgi:hypothetical protein
MSYCLIVAWVFLGPASSDRSWQYYCSAPGLSEFQRQYIAGFFDDFCRCVGPKQRFFCVEQIVYLPSNALPEGLRLQAYINLAHGGHGQLYFEWRRPLAGNEQWARAFGDVGDKGDKSRRYGGEVMHYYNGFKVLQRNIDVIPSSTDFSTYKVVVAPNLRLIDDATFARLQTFVTDGGPRAQLPCWDAEDGLQYETGTSAGYIR